MLLSGSADDLMANMNPDIPETSASSDVASFEVPTVDTLAGGD